MELSDNFVAIEKDAEDAPVKDIKWYGKKDRTEDESIHDKGKGEPITIRLFEFKFPPNLDKLPTKEELLTKELIRFIKTSLWGDGLRAVLEPRVEIDKDGYKVFVPAQAKTGQSFLENPKTLQEWI